MDANGNDSPTDSHDSFFDDVVITFPEPPVISTAKFPIQPSTSSSNPPTHVTQLNAEELSDMNTTARNNIDRRTNKLLRLLQSANQGTSTANAVPPSIRPDTAMINSAEPSEMNPMPQTDVDRRNNKLLKLFQSANQTAIISNVVAQRVYVRTTTDRAAESSDADQATQPVNRMKEKLMKSLQSILEEEIVPCSQEVQADTVNHLGSQEGSDFTQPPAEITIKEEPSQHLSLEVSGDTQNHLGSQESNLTQPPPAKRIKQEIVNCSQEVQEDSVNHLGSDDSDLTQPPPAKRIKQEIVNCSQEVHGDSINHLGSQDSSGQTQSPKEITIKEEHDNLRNVKNEASSSHRFHFAPVVDENPLYYDQQMDYYYPGVESGFQGSSLAVYRGSPVPSLDSIMSQPKNELPNEGKENQKSTRSTNQLKSLTNCATERRNPLSLSLDSTLPPQERMEKNTTHQSPVTIKKENTEKSQRKKPVSLKNEVVEGTDSDCSMEAAWGSQLSQNTNDTVLPPGSQKPRPSLVRDSSMEVQFDEQSQLPCSCGAVCICILRTETST